MPWDLFRGSKGGRGLHACFDKLTTRWLVWLGKVASPVARISIRARRYERARSSGVYLTGSSTNLDFSLPHGSPQSYSKSHRSTPLPSLQQGITPAISAASAASRALRSYGSAMASPSPI